MQFGNRGRQSKSKPISRLRAAGLPAIKPAEQAFMLFLGYAGPIITDPNHRAVMVPRQRQPDASALRGMDDGIFDQVGKQLNQELAVATDGEGFWICQFQRVACFLGDGFEQFAHLDEKRTKIQGRKSGPPRSAFDLRDPQQAANRPSISSALAMAASKAAR